MDPTSGPDGWPLTGTKSPTPPYASRRHQIFAFIIGLPRVGALLPTVPLAARLSFDYGWNPLVFSMDAGSVSKLVAYDVAMNLPRPQIQRAQGHKVKLRGPVANTPSQRLHVAAYRY